MIGANPKSMTDAQSIRDSIVKEKTSWLPIFKDKECQGQLQIKTQFIDDMNSKMGATVFEGGNEGSTEATTSKSSTAGTIAKVLGGLGVAAIAGDLVYT